MTTYLQFTDEELINLLRNDDHYALKALFNRYYKSLCHFCSIYINDLSAAEEIVADLFMKIWDNRLDTTILNIKSYLFTSAKNLSLNYNQKKKAPISSLEDIQLDQNLIKDGNTPLTILSGRESYRSVLEVIEKLPPSQRQVLLMSRIDGIDKREIANVLGITVRTVETTLYQAIGNLRNLLKDQRKFSSRS
ncbi:RNA polymerase sigma factor [Mucilaginibacter terrenus]|uniref:RNA polymerase sigma factor n=1 Tax=Mucilaginibacter terrenus TaxID=2482727 RepID=UPI00140349EA|nr:RNA polymerase sigma-70 factor [Mucilaginibacter terrenus]